MDSKIIGKANLRFRLLTGILSVIVLSYITSILYSTHRGMILTKDNAERLGHEIVSRYAGNIGTDIEHVIAILESIAILSARVREQKYPDAHLFLSRLMKDILEEKIKREIIIVFR